MTKRYFLVFLIRIFFFESAFALREASSPFVTAQIYGQLGNNLFQVAAASALAWESGAEPCFPDFNPASPLYRHVFFRCSTICPGNFSFRWEEPTYSYQTIPYNPDMKMIGYFQSEKYFANHRNRILDLFAPLPEDLLYIQNKYSDLLAHPCTVGVQVRYYKWEFPTEDLFPQYGKEYLETAMALFPRSSLFVVSSNNLEFARASVPTWAELVLFLENEPHYIDLHLLSLCKHNIITNSSFGWWAAWLNRNPGRIVVRPAVWINGLCTDDVCPADWITVRTKYE